MVSLPISTLASVVLSGLAAAAILGLDREMGIWVSLGLLAAAMAVGRLANAEQSNAAYREMLLAWSRRRPTRTLAYRCVQGLIFGGVALAICGGLRLIDDESSGRWLVQVGIVALSVGLAVGVIVRSAIGGRSAADVD